MRRLLLQAVLAVSCAQPILAQSYPKEDYPKLEAFVGYSVLGRTNNNVTNFGPVTENSTITTTTGFELATIGNLKRWIGFKGDFSGYFAEDRDQALVRACPDCPTAAGTVRLKTRLFESMGGPEVKARNNTRWTPFAHTLFGLAHSTSTFNVTGPTANFSQRASDGAFAMAMGGGVDFRVADRFSLRSSVDYNPVFFGPNDTVANHRQDFVRFSVGVLFH